MEFEKKGLNPRVNEKSVSKDTKETDSIQKSLYNHNTSAITEPPSKIFGTKHMPLSIRDVAQKQYKEASERFIYAYQSYEKTGVFLKKAKETGDLEQIDYFAFYYKKARNDMIGAINAMDRFKRIINKIANNDISYQ